MFYYKKNFPFPSLKYLFQMERLKIAAASFMIIQIAKPKKMIRVILST